MLVIERVTFDVLHHHVDGAVGGSAQIVNCNCVWMTKTTRRLSFAPETSQPFGVVSHFRRQNFDGDAIAKQDVARTINRAHAAFAEQRLHLVLAVEHGVDDRGGIGLQGPRHQSNRNSRCRRILLCRQCSISFGDLGAQPPVS